MEISTDAANKILEQVSNAADAEDLHYVLAATDNITNTGARTRMWDFALPDPEDVVKMIKTGEWNTEVVVPS